MRRSVLFDVEALRGFDVLQVDAADGGLEKLAELDDVVGIFRIHLEVEHIDIGEALEEDALAFHDGLARQRADVPQAQDRRAIGHHRHQVPLRGVLEGTLGDSSGFPGRVPPRPGV